MFGFLCYCINDEQSHKHKTEDIKDKHINAVQ